MVQLAMQKRLAKEILQCGDKRVWLDPQQMEKISQIKTREGIRQLINDGVITKKSGIKIKEKLHPKFFSKFKQRMLYDAIYRRKLKPHVSKMTYEQREKYEKMLKEKHANHKNDWYQYLIEKEDLFKHAGHELYTDPEPTPIIEQGEEKIADLNEYDIELIHKWQFMQELLSNPEALKQEIISNQHGVFLDQIELVRQQLTERNLQDYVNGTKILKEDDDEEMDEDKLFGDREKGKKKN
eukprot:TRINITY_DN5793_c0_g1_i1.p1 TRINITY_DN5793_c0_g1~~TRINITY_DN5793_c0_g1_i1.p1  ORF type:complete len:239 (-),score=87.17 TRINITY_DN5793_c0_g1_i1:81-797(-)